MIILERCRIAPPDSVEELRLPLTFLDMFWTDSFPVRRLLFYEFPCSGSHFTDKIIPNVKTSLSLALLHFPPFAGHLLHPLGPGMPEIQFKNGDSVSVVFAEADDDFSYLIGNHPRDAEKFYPLLPDLPPVIHVDNSRLVPLLAVQVTLFPDHGVSVGLINQHVVGDARTTVNFIKSWATMCRSGGDAEFLVDKSLHPVHDRCLIKDPTGKLLEKNWNYMRSLGSEPQRRVSLQNKVRATFVMKEADIQKLKNVAARAMGPDSDHHVSAFTLTCGYVWSCLAKSGAAVGEDDGIDQFFFPADYRARLDPPLPPSYFGNCLGFFFLKSPRSQLIGDSGFIVAVMLIGEAIYKRFRCNKEEIMKSAGDWADQLAAVDWNRVLATAGSPRFDVYDADFGWGKPNKYESMAVDSGFLMSVCKTGKNLEIGLCLAKIKMDAFATIFNHGLLGTESIT
ncbi:hypothetical protein ACS0TY_024332 [Phlomoides rotata]